MPAKYYFLEKDEARQNTRASIFENSEPVQSRCFYLGASNNLGHTFLSIKSIPAASFQKETYDAIGVHIFLEGGKSPDLPLPG